VKYSGYSIEKLENDSAKADQISGSIFMSLEVGDNVVRFIPPKIGVPSPFRVTAMHYVDAVPGLEKMLVFACPRVELKEPCPVCQESDRLGKSHNPLDRERAYAISAGLRVYAAVIDRSVEDPTMAIRVLAFGKMIHNQLKAIRKNPRLGGDFTDPTDKGFDVIISREGTGKQDTKYVVAADRSNCALADDPEVINWIIENQPDLDDEVNPVVPEELLAAWQAVSMRSQREPQRPGTRAGSQLMQVRKPASGAAQDAKGEVEYDDDFNPVPPKKR
jgi:hypothetical protein